MSILQKLILLFFGLVATDLVQAQEAVSFQYLTKKEGLSQSSVFAIAQDSVGLMWFGTRDGLNKFDGYQFKVYKKEPSAHSIIANDIRTLYVDPQEKYLWIGTVAGLSQYRSASDDFINFTHVPNDSNSISNDAIRTIYRDRKDRLWIGTSVGLNLYHPNQQRFTRFFLGSPSNNSHDVKAILEDRNGQVWFGTQNGLYVLEEKTNDSYTFVRKDQTTGFQLSDAHIKSMLEDEAGNLWIGTESGGINHWNRKKNTFKVYQSDEKDATALSHNNIRSMCFDQQGNLWVGTFVGLNFLPKGKTSFVKYYKKEPGTTGLSDESIRSVFLDRRGSLWIGTYYGGINYLDKDYNRFTNFKPKLLGNSLSGEVVSSFTEDAKGNLWIGTEGGGLNYYNTSTKKFKTYQAQPNLSNSLSGNNVKQLLLDSGQLWVGTFQAGLNRLYIETQQFQHFKHDPNDENSLSSNNVYGLYKAGDLLWILTYGAGLDIYDLTNKQFYHYPHRPKNRLSLSSNLARVFLQTQDGQLWIGTDEGLNKVTRKTDGFPERFDTFLEEEKVYALQEDDQHNIWVGTFSNGFFKFDTKNYTTEHFTTDDGLPGNTIFGILSVGDHALWLSTNNGLAMFDTESKIFTNYHYSNGLENAEYNFNAYYKTRDGDLLFGGLNGFTKFDPNKISPNKFVPPLVFTELRQNHQVVKIDPEHGVLKRNLNEINQLTFRNNEANFSIGFAALDYFSPENNRYAFKLEGLDRDWNYTVGKTEATYTIQRAGAYLFRLKGANSDGVWNPVERQLEIVVLPPFWKTWWAYFIYSAAFVAIIWAALRFIRLRHKLQLQQIAKQQQEELHEVKLRFFTNITHEFRTPLTLILGPIKDLIAKEKHHPKIMQQLLSIEKNAERLLNLVNQVLTFRRLATDHESMQVVHSHMVNFLKEIFLSFQETARLRNIDYVFNTTTPLLESYFDEDKLEKVFFNLLSNAFKFTPDGGKIELYITEKERHIEVRVTDTGIGIAPELQDQIFKRFYEKSNAISTIKGTGIGLAISKQLVELHQGKIFVADHLEANSGAIFVVQLPKERVDFKEESGTKEIWKSEKINAYKELPKVKSNTTSVALQTQDSAKHELPLLLIVEDNQEINNYIQQIFTADYRLIAVGNGVEGLEKTKKYAPDLIISDVMMPEMDGITFCMKLKSDLEISHIPVILLTARTATLFKMEGLKTGADDYLTKPFEPEELRLRVHNIIQARENMKHKFARVLDFNPKEITVTSSDEKFLEDAMKVVEQHIDSYEFNVEQFAIDLAISRPLLFTKLKALTGQTPNNFVKTIRLKRAAQLLKTEKLNVSQIAYKVGFKDPKYFRKCFKQQFEIVPSEYVKEKGGF